MNEMIIDLPTSCQMEYFEFLKCLEFLDVMLHCVVTDVFHKNGITWKENLLKFWVICIIYLVKTFHNFNFILRKHWL
jgi:hypothetical protein